MFQSLDLLQLLQCSWTSFNYYCYNVVMRLYSIIDDPLFDHVPSAAIVSANKEVRGLVIQVIIN